MITIQIADLQIWDREASALEHGRPVPGLLLLAVRSHQTSPRCPLQTRLDEAIAQEDERGSAKRKQPDDDGQEAAQRKSQKMRADRERKTTLVLSMSTPDSTVLSQRLTSSTRARMPAMFRTFPR